MGELLSGNHTAVLGLMLVAMAIVGYRATSRARRSSPGNPLHDLKSSFTRIEQSPPGRALQAEVHLHDVAREVEARIETRMLVLDQMILSADREIRRLQERLNELGGANSPQGGSGNSPDRLKIPGDLRPGGPNLLGQTILALAARGMSPEVIADMTDQPIARVISLIEAARSIERRDAA